MNIASSDSKGTICDVIKQNESQLANTDFEIKPVKIQKFPYFFFVLKQLSTASICGPTNQFSWGFLLNVALKM